MSPGDAVLVAVSGGADSLALLDLTARSAEPLGLTPVVAHVDHGWRADSGADALFVAEQAERSGLRAVVERPSLPDRSEATARAARVAFFARLAGAVGARGVLLGHTADDQAETVLLHLLRGSGGRGLGGMRPRTSIDTPDGPVDLLRPLLGVRRAELAAYCSRRGLEPRLDATNGDKRYTRNRLRGELLPAAERVRSGATRALARAAEILFDDAAYLADAARDALARIARHEQDRVVLDRSSFARLPTALQRAALRVLAGDLLGPTDDVGLERIEAVRAAILTARGRSLLQWPGPVDVRIERGEAIFSRRR